MTWWYKQDDCAHRGTVHRGTVHRGTVNTLCGLNFRAFRSRVADPPDHQICLNCDLIPEEYNEWRVLGAAMAGGVTKSRGQYFFGEVSMPADSLLAAALRRLEEAGKVTAPAGDGGVRTTEIGAMRWLMLDQRRANVAAVTGLLTLPSPP